MQKGPFAKDVLKDVTRGLRESIATARRAGVAKSQIILDPGIGFGKSFAQNYELLGKLPQLAQLGYPLLVGTSRKGFLGATLALDGKSAAPEERIWATAATVTASILNGAHIVRAARRPRNGSGRPCHGLPAAFRPRLRTPVHEDLTISI